MHATYNKVNETCPNHNRHYFNVLLYMPCLVSKDHWHLSVLFAPVECKFECECECECKQSNCNIFRIARIHIAKPIHIFYIVCISYVQIMKTFQSQMRCTFFMMRKLNIYSWHMCKCSKNWFSQRTHATLAYISMWLSSLHESVESIRNESHQTVLKSCAKNQFPIVI